MSDPGGNGVSGEENPYAPPKAEIRERSDEWWRRCDELLQGKGLSEAMIKPPATRLMRRLGIPHRPFVYASLKFDLMFAVVVSLFSCLAGMSVYWIDPPPGQSWSLLGESVRSVGLQSFAPLIGFPAGFAVNRWWLRRRHDLPPWEEFREQVRDSMNEANREDFESEACVSKG